MESFEKKSVLWREREVPLGVVVRVHDSLNRDREAVKLIGAEITQVSFYDFHTGDLVYTSDESLFCPSRCISIEDAMNNKKYVKVGKDGERISKISGMFLDDDPKSEKYGLEIKLKKN